MKIISITLAVIVVLGNTILEVKKEFDIKNGIYDKETPYRLFPWLKSVFKKSTDTDGEE